MFLRFSIKPMAQDSEQHLVLSTDGNVTVGHRYMVQREPCGRIQYTTKIAEKLQWNFSVDVCDVRLGCQSNKI